MTRNSRIAFGLLLAAFVATAGLLLRAEPPQPVGTWASLGATPESRVGAAAVTLPDGRTLIMGGSLDGAPTDAVAIVNPADGSFASGGQLLAPRVGHTATLLEDGRVLVAGGTVGGLLRADLELFDPFTGTSVPGATMGQPRSGHAAARLADGRVLIVGGTGVDGVLQTAEIYDPSTASTSPATFPMHTARTGASATTLIDGRVLIAGGNSGIGTPDLASAELFDPSTQLFEVADSVLSVARSGHSAVLLPHNNSVLIAGGSSEGVPQRVADLFLPAEFPDPYSYGTGHFGPTGNMVMARSGAVGAPHIEGYAFVAGGGVPDADAYRFATIKTDKDDYAPGEQAIITGSGWEADSEVTLVFQEDPAVHDDYVLHVPTDGEGNFYLDTWAPEEHDLNVRFYLTAKQGMPGIERRAQVTFTDSRTITAATLNGGTVVTVAPGATISAKVFVTTDNSGGNQNWRSTSWRIATTAPGSTTCVDTPDHDGSGSYDETFNIVAPVSAGTYNTYFLAHRDGTCTATQQSNLFTLSGSVIVDAAAPTVVSINRVTGPTTNAASVQWTVTFSESVTGVESGDFALVGSGLTSTSITGVTGSGSSYTVTANTGNGSGTLGLNLVDDDSIQDAATNKLGGTGLGNGSFTGQVYTLDRTLTPTITAANKPYDGNTTATILTRGFTSALSVTEDVTVTGGTATFADRNAANGKTVTATGLSLTGTASAKYVLSSTSATATANITAAPLTINATSDSRGYDGTTASAATPTVVGTVYAPDTVTGLDQVFDSRNAGARTLTVSAYTVNDGNGGLNYAVTTNTASGTISQAALTINATSDSRGYNGTTDSAATPTVAGTVYAPDTVTGLDQVFDSRNAGARTLTVSAYTVNDGNGGLNYAVTTNTASGTISQAPLTINATTDSRGYDGTTASAATPTVVGTVYAPDTVTGLDQVFDSRNAGARTLTASYTVNDGNGGLNYLVTANTASGTITQAPLTINAANDSRGYDGTTDSAATPTVVGTVYAPDTVTGLDQVFDSRNAGARTLTASYTVNDGNGGANYAVTTNTASGTINQAPLTINATSDSRGYDGTTASAATPTVVGTVYAPDTVTGLDQIFDSRNAGARTLTVTTYTVNDGNGGLNYAVTTNTASGTISQAPLTINATTDSRGYDGTTASAATPTVVGTVYAPDTVTGLDQIFDSRNAGARTLSVTAYTVNDANGGLNYAVTMNTASGTITQAPLTINATTDSRGYDGTTDSAATPTVVGTVYAPDTVTALDQVFDSRNAGARTLAASYTVNDGNGGLNYAVTANTASGTITQAPLTINATADSRGYDGTTASAATPTVVGTVYAPDTVTGLDQVFDSRNAGARTLTVTAYTVNDANGGLNYAVTTNTASGTISQAPLTINATTDSRGYDGTTASAATPTVVGTVYAPDSVTGLDQVFDSRNAGARTLTVTAYTVNDGNGGLNYAVTTNTASGTISQAPLTINATTDSRGYDGTTDSAATPTVVGTVYAPDTVTGLDQIFDSRNAGVRTLTVTAYTVNDANGGLNYAVTVNTVSGTITQAPLTINATTDSRGYDGTTDSAATPTVGGTVYAPDTVTGLDQVFDSRNAGARTLTVSGGYSVNDGNGGNNYSVTTNTASGTISQATLTINATSDSRGYDGTTASAATPTVVGTVYTPDTVTGLDQVFDSRNAGARTLTASYTVNDGNSGNNYAVTANPASGTISQAPLTINATPDSRGYNGTTASVATPTVVGTVYAPDTVTGLTQVFDSRNAGARTLTASYTVNDGNGGLNYAVTANPASGTISQASLTINATPDSRGYDGTTASAATPTVVGTVYAPDTVTGLTQVFDSRNAGTRTLTASYAVNDGNGGLNYSVTANPASGTISQASLTINATSDSRGYDGTTASAATPTVIGTVYAPDTVTGLDQAFDSRNAGARTLTVTAYTVNDGNGGLNYAVITNTASGTISQASLTIDATTDSRGYDGTTASAATPTVMGTVYAPDTVTGLDQVFDSRNAGARTLTVTAYTVNDANSGLNYAVTVNTASGTIAQAPLTINATTDSRGYDGTTDSAATPTVMGTVYAPDTVTGLDQVFQSKNVLGTNGSTLAVSAYTVNDGNGGLNYAVTTNTASGTITQRVLLVSATGINKTYNGNTAATVTFADNRVAGDVFTVSGTASFADKNAAPGKTVSVIGIALAGADAANYAPNTSATTTATIFQRALVVAATGVNKVYDGNAIATVTLSDNRVAGDVLTLAYASASFADANWGMAKPVSVSGINVTGIDAPNYTFNTTATTTADITKRPITVTADAKSKPFGAPDPAFTHQVTSGSLVVGESLSGSLTRFANPPTTEAVGSYPILVGTLSAGTNYNLTYVGDNLTIGAWTAQGFHQPIGISNSMFVPAGSGGAVPSAPSGTAAWNSAKGGSTVPLKFNIFAGGVEKTSVNDVLSLVANRLQCAGTPFEDPVEQLDNAGATTLRYDGVPGSGGQFIQNWKTSKVNTDECYRVALTFKDSSVLYTFVKLKK